MQLTEYHAKYMALALSKSTSSNNFEKLIGTLADAQVDLNPHQVEAALFAFKSPFSKGVILADEVGLGKTIEAGIIISQKWSEMKRKIIIIVPANLRRQWQLELEEKFYLSSIILDGDTYKTYEKSGVENPFIQEEIIITSYHFANSKSSFISFVNWDLAVIDEAHRLRNAYKTENVIARSIKNSLGNCFKLLLTATPLQNSLLELYGLVSFVDDYTFGDIESFKMQFLGLKNENQKEYSDIVSRLNTLCMRTLRRQVLEYIKYTERFLITQEFIPTSDEQYFYDIFTNYLQKDKLWALPNSGRHLISMILWKLLSSSTFAIAGTLENLIIRLEEMLSTGFYKNSKIQNDMVLSDYEEIESNISYKRKKLTDSDKISIKCELEELKSYFSLASSITINAKGNALIIALNKGFEKLKILKSPQKVVIFTESRRTQNYIYELLQQTKFKDTIVLFNGGLTTSEKRHAVVDKFRDSAKIMIATEAAAEGINLQFCAMIINYDLPFNPQRIEQRIGRCHRYGQKHDVVVINFLNKNNIADQRVYELLCNKFQLFEGVFGASDGVLGDIDTLDFEKRVIEIYQNCRTQEEIESKFNDLRKSLEPEINEQMNSTKKKLLENFDEDVASKLRVNLDNSNTYLNKYDTMLWELTKYYLRNHAHFKGNSFFLEKNPFYKFYPSLMYYFFDKNASKSQRYRMNHPIAQKIIFDMKYNHRLFDGDITFDLTNHTPKISVLEPLKGNAGFIALYNLSFSGFENEDHLIFVATDKSGNVISSELCQKLWSLDGKCTNNSYRYDDLKEALKKNKISDDDFEEEVEKLNTHIDDEYKSKLHSLFENEKAKLLSEVSIRNSGFFDNEIEKLDKWAKDIKKSMEKQITEIDSKINELKALARKTTKLQDKLNLQKEIKQIEANRNEKRLSLYDEQDKVDVQKDKLIEDTQRKLEQNVKEECIFVVSWRVE